MEHEIDAARASVPLGVARLGGRDPRRKEHPEGKGALHPVHREQRDHREDQADDDCECRAQPEREEPCHGLFGRYGRARRLRRSNEAQHLVDSGYETDLEIFTDLVRHFFEVGLVVFRQEDARDPGAVGR